MFTYYLENCHFTKWRQICFFCQYLYHKTYLFIQEVDQTDSAESDQCSIEDYHKIVTQMYKHTLRNIQKDNAQTVS